MARSRLRLHPGRWRIQQKIVVPFAIAVVSVMAIAAVMIVILFNRHSDTETNDKLRRWLDTVTTTGYLQLALENADMLRNLKSGLGVDVVASYANGYVAGGTLDQSDWSIDERRRLNDMLLRANRIPDRASTFHGPNGTVRLVHQRLEPPDRGVVLISLAAPMTDVEQARQRMALAVATVTGVGILLVAIIGASIARTITGRIAALAWGTRRIAEGDWNHAVDVGSQDEIGELATAFNTMTDQLRESHAKLIESERLATAGQMAAAFAHEVRNPLSSIRMMMQLASERASDAKTSKYIVNTIEEIDRLNGIVEEMLDFAKSPEANRATCDVREALADVMDLLETSFRGQHIETTFDASATHHTEADVDALKRAFLNVLLNAIQAQPNGGKIDATITRVADDLYVAISDAGPGFSDAALENLFRPFATTKTRGTGLGLVTTKRIVEQHHGEIRVENPSHGGARVTLVLPIISQGGRT